MGTISQRSVNKREVERAINELQDANVHIAYVISIFAAAIHDINEANETIPDSYLSISQRLLDISDVLDKSCTVLFAVDDDL